jgi:hypothetical protein
MIERRPFGRTGHSSTVTLFGGAALARATQDEADRTHTTWYRPLEAPADIDRGIHWIMGLLPDAFINAAGALTLLRRTLDAASGFERRSSDVEMAEMLGAPRMTSLVGLPT